MIVKMLISHSQSYVGTVNKKAQTEGLRFGVLKCVI